jgi:hypothetical protein
MPRFYLDVREGTRFIPNEEGLEFDSLDAAEREAASAAAEIGTGPPAEGGCSGGHGRAKERASPAGADRDGFHGGQPGGPGAGPVRVRQSSANFRYDALWNPRAWLSLNSSDEAWYEAKVLGGMPHAAPSDPR